MLRTFLESIGWWRLPSARLSHAASVDRRLKFDQPKPADRRPSSALHPGGATERRRCPQRPVGARGVSASVSYRNGDLT